MAAARFVHLRLHTEYSIVDGIARVSRSQSARYPAWLRHSAVTRYGVSRWRGFSTQRSQPMTGWTQQGGIPRALRPAHAGLRREPLAGARPAQARVVEGHFRPH